MKIWGAGGSQRQKYINTDEKHTPRAHHTPSSASCLNSGRGGSSTSNQPEASLSAGLNVGDAFYTRRNLSIAQGGSVTWAFGSVLQQQLSIAEADDVLKKKRSLVHRNTLSKVEAGARACRNGVPRVHIINGNADLGGLTGRGIGCRIFDQIS